jgi:(1->4)-alpha-D-glucan 1-alpha-D-glucosylmutase
LERAVVAQLNPLSTYRLQFGPRFRFRDAEAIVPYLAALGVDCIYASPYFRARPGSEHGYDIVDQNHLNPEVGDDAEHRALIAAARRNGISHLVDFVPNHMGIGAENPWWMDVLTLGRRSAYAHFFDIDWQSRTLARGKIVLPFLGDHYGAVLERGELTVAFDAGSGTFTLRYFEHIFPLAPHTYATVIAGLPELHEIAAAFAGLRSRSRDTLRRTVQRDRARGLSNMLALRCGGDPGLVSRIDAAVAALSADPNRLDELVRAQHYRLVFWRVAADEINYRRFFDINDLAGLRVEDAEVLTRTHALLFAMIGDGRVDGVRVDHIDGLANPGGYANLLIDYAAALDRPLYVVVEKILADGERLRPTWRVAGTTGYEFMNLVAGLFVDAASEAIFDRLYRRALDRPGQFAEEAYAAKRRLMQIDLASELQVLADGLARIAQSDRRSNDFTTIGLRRALVEVIAALPVYRTYVVEETIEVDDRRIIEQACRVARDRAESPDITIFDFIRDVLTLAVLQVPGVRYNRVEVVRFVMRFQQYTGPVTAKSIEDTAFYRYVRLAALNDVGGDPTRFGRSPAEFHAANAERARSRPGGMLATATHDHKRGEDTRLRIAAITEFPAEWSRAVVRWWRMNTDLRDAQPTTPSRVDEYLFYQTVVGSLPPDWLAPGAAVDGPARTAYVERIASYALKAAREAKLHTSWAAPHDAYEAGLDRFVRGALDAEAAFWRDVRLFAAQVAPVAAVHGLAQVALKLTAPGVADTYQGCELWDFSLVDPDNRRPVDYPARQAALAAFAAGIDRGALVDELLDTWPDGRIKLYLTWRLLQLRRESRASFEGGYRALGVSDDGIVAFARADIVTIVPRLVRRRLNGRGLRIAAGTTRIDGLGPGRRYRNVVDGALITTLSDGTLRASDVLGRCPVAVLVPAI